MKFKSLFVLLLLGLFSFGSSSAHAEAKAGTLGFGGQMTLTGITGLAGTFQGSSFYIDGVFGLESFGNNDALQMAGRIWFPIHLGDNADFSVGGGVGIVNQDDTDLHIEAGGKIRMFMTSNVALSTELGLAYIATGGDNTDDPYGIGGEIFGAAGITYFFE